MKKFTVPLFLFIALTSQDTNAQCQLVTNIVGYTPTSDTTEVTQLNWLAFDQGKVIATGLKDTPEKFKTCKIINGNKQYLLPGLIDAHGHFTYLGNEMLRVKLRGVTSESDAIMQVKAFAEENKKSLGVLGGGWNEVLWLNQQFPSKASLDEIGIDKPILLDRIDGHAAWANSKALEIAGITDSTPDPKGGKIVRDKKGHATGVLIDIAVYLVRNKIPPATLKEKQPNT